jgi:EXLDI family protein
VKELTMQQYRLAREGKVDLLFNGEEIVSLSSKDEDPEKLRWRDLTVYRTEKGKFVIYDVGHSQIEGERTKRRAWVCDTYADIPRVLRRKNSRGEDYYSNLILVLFEELEEKIGEDFTNVITEAI